MKILLASIGTRGDIEPFIKLGELLNANGHEVIYHFPSQLTNLISEGSHYYEFTNLFLELLEGEDAEIVMSGKSVLLKIRSILRLYKKGMMINKLLISEQHEVIKSENPDLIIHNGKCNYPTLWSLEGKGNTVMVSPIPHFIHRTIGFPHVGFEKLSGIFPDKFTYWLANFGLTKTIFDAQKAIPGSSIFSRKEIKNKILEGKLAYTISKSLYSGPTLPKENVKVIGFNNYSDKKEWNINSDTFEFIKRDTKKIFITFGSMVNSRPLEISKIIYEELERFNIDVIINIASGGLIKLEEFELKDNFHFTKSIPYDWILDRVDSVIHHGGSGTTHLGIKHGCATLILPHIMDQMSWNDLIYKLGAGPKGCSISNLNSAKLKKLVELLLQNNKYKIKAEELSSQMKLEKISEESYKFLLE